MSSTEAQPKLSRRVVKIVFLLLGLSGALLFSLVRSEAFARWLVMLAVESASADGQAKITLEGMTGTIADGFNIESARLIRRNPSLDATFRQVQVSLNFARLFQAGVISISGSTGHIDICGTIPLRCPFIELPAYRGSACLAALPTNIEIADFSIASAKIVPWSELPGEIQVGTFTIKTGELKGEQNLQVAATAIWKEQLIASASYSGLLKPRQQRLEGKVDLCIAGQKVSGEVNLAQKRRKPEISGYIASASIDVARLSHWLGPLWQNHFPFGFDGYLDCSGSWLFNPDVGFLGNLSGKCRQLRVVALGLYFTLLELNGNWKLFDGNFIFNDSGSSVVGFPAELTGQIDSVMKPQRNWRLNLECPEINFARLASDLPWGIKYSFKLPDLSGNAVLSVSFNGRNPDIAAKISTDGLMVSQKNNDRKISGCAGYYQTGLGSSSLELEFVTESQRILPPIVARFHKGHTSLVTQLAPAAGMVNFAWKLQGSPDQDLVFKGNLTAAGTEISVFDGFWHSGIGHLQAIAGDSAAGSTYVADGVTFLDLILAR